MHEEFAYANLPSGAEVRRSKKGARKKLILKTSFRLTTIFSRRRVDDCSIQVPEDTNMISPTLKLIAYIMFGINLLAIIICGSWLYWQRDSPQVRVSQPFFLALVLLGCAVSSSTILAMAQEDDGDGPVAACMTIPWLYSVGFSITFGRFVCPLTGSVV
jgi:hypothetical protein